MCFQPGTFCRKSLLTSGRFLPELMLSICTTMLGFTMRNVSARKASPKPESKIDALMNHMEGHNFVTALTLRISAAYQINGIIWKSPIIAQIGSNKRDCTAAVYLFPVSILSFNLYALSYNVNRSRILYVTYHTFIPPHSVDYEWRFFCKRRVSCIHIIKTLEVMSRIVSGTHCTNKTTSLCFPLMCERGA